MTQEALKLALAAFYQIFESTPPYRDDGTCVINDKSVELSNKAIAAIKEALAQEQEPVACIYKGYLYMAHEFQSGQVPVDSQPLYTTSPQRTWVKLEGEEIRNLWEEATKPDRSTMTMVTSFARAIEAKLKERNFA